jgi:thermostable 8-oxoguanine DNA glycosylase
MEGADKMNDKKLRSDLDALTEQEKEEVLNAFKCAFEAMKHATIVLTETVIKVMPELLKSDTNDLTGLCDNEEGVS